MVGYSNTTKHRVGKKKTPLRALDTVIVKIVDRKNFGPYNTWTVKILELFGFFGKLEHFYGPDILRSRCGFGLPST